MAHDLAALKAVRAKTNAPIMACITTLAQTAGNIDAAVYHLLQQHAATLALQTGASPSACFAALAQTHGSETHALRILRIAGRLPPQERALTAQARQDASLRARVQAVHDGTTELTTLTTAEEVHQFAWTYNWDNGHAAMWQVISHSQCDRGTALLVYWHAAPRALYQYARREDVPPHNQEAYDFVTTLETQYMHGQYTQQTIAFDPHNDDGTDWTDDDLEDNTFLPSLMGSRQHHPHQRPIPERMQEATPGRCLKRILVAA